jgi:hypothetical protein
LTISKNTCIEPLTNTQNDGTKWFYKHILVSGLLTIHSIKRKCTRNTLIHHLFTLSLTCILFFNIWWINCNRTHIVVCMNTIMSTF